MIALSSKEPTRFTPEWRVDEADAPVFLIRAGSVLEREMLEAELAGEHRAGRVFDVELLAEFVSGLETLLAGDDGRLQLIELANAERNGGELQPSETQMLAEARELLAEHWPQYRALVARAQRRHQLAPLLALRRFCVGWENVDVEFARGPDGLVSLTALGALSPIEMKVAGREAYRLLYCGDDTAKNSDAPSKSGADQPTSPSAVTSKGAGKSPASGGRKTRSSPSRRGSGQSSTSG